MTLRDGWALVQVEVEGAAGRSWSALDECLMRAELRKIVGWLRRIGAGRTPKPLEFTEPNRAFECVRNDEHAEIRVWFQGEVRPIWAGHDDPWARDLSLDLTVARADVLEAADALGAEVDAIEAS